MTMLLRVRGVQPIPTLWSRCSTALLVAAALGAAGTAVIRRISVEGDSMRPTLLPGDRVLAVRARRAAAGTVVAVPDPRRVSRLLVKRVVAAGAGGATVAGDNPAASTDSRSFGPVPRVWGRVLYRYHPASRAGRVR